MAIRDQNDPAAVVAYVGDRVINETSEFSNTKVGLSIGEIVIIDEDLTIVGPDDVWLDQSSGFKLGPIKCAVMFGRETGASATVVNPNKLHSKCTSNLQV